MLPFYVVIYFGFFPKDYCFEKNSLDSDVTSFYVRSVALIMETGYLGDRSSYTLRFPRAAGEPPCAYALRGLTDAFPPAGVFAYTGC